MSIFTMPLLSAFLLAAALPAAAQNRTVTHEPDDANVAEANAFMNAKLIAIDRDRDRIQVRDNYGVRKTLTLADNASMPEGRIKAGTDVILAVRGAGNRARVVSVQPSVPGSARAGTLMNVEPVFIPGRGDVARTDDRPGLADVATAQTRFQSGTVVPPAAAGTMRTDDPQFLASGATVDPTIANQNVATGGVPNTSGVGVAGGVAGSGSIVAGGAASQLQAGAVAGTTVQSGADFSGTSVAGSDPRSQTLVAPVPGTTIAGPVTSPGNTTIIGDESGGQTRTGHITGTTLQTGAPTGSPNVLGAPSNTTTLTTPVQGTTTRSAAQTGPTSTAGVTGLGSPGAQGANPNGAQAGPNTRRTGGRTTPPARTSNGTSDGTVTAPPAARIPQTSVGSTTNRSTSGTRATSGTSSSSSTSADAAQSQVANTAQGQMTFTRSQVPPAAGTTQRTQATTTNGSGTVFTNANLGGGQTAVTTQQTPAGTFTTVNRVGGTQQAMGGGGATTGTSFTPGAGAAGNTAAGTTGVGNNAVGPGIAGPGVGVNVAAVVPVGAAAVQQTTIGSSPTIGSRQESVPNPGGGLGADASPLPIGHAVQAFEASMARLAQKADEVDAAFARYKEACIGLSSPIGNMGTREWLDIWDGVNIPTETRDQCEPLLAVALRLGNAVKQGVQTAEDSARRSGVLPGVTRQIRAQYNMEWGGWDR